MHKPSLYIIDPCCQRPELEAFNYVTTLSSLPCSLHLPAFFGMSSLDDPYQGSCAGILILGSSANVSENRPWQIELIQWLDKKITQDIPVFGICYGHQLLAHMGGASVIRSSEKKHVGSRLFSFQEDTKLSFTAQERPLIVSHYEIVSTLPTGFTTWASSALFEFEGLRSLTQPIWSVQAHPEALPCFAERQNFAVHQEDECRAFGQDILFSFFQMVSSRAGYLNR